MRNWLCFIVAALCFAGALSAQRRVDPRNTYHRVLCIVPIVGSGSWEDPRRPQYAPVEIDAAGGTGIIGYTHQISDDGKFALVEFVARDPDALAPILADKTITSFVKGRDKRADILAAFIKFKRNFDLDNFGVAMP